MVRYDTPLHCQQCVPAPVPLSYQPMHNRASHAHCEPESHRSASMVTLTLPPTTYLAADPSTQHLCAVAWIDNGQQPVGPSSPATGVVDLQMGGCVSGGRLQTARPQHKNPTVDSRRLCTLSQSLSQSLVTSSAQPLSLPAQPCVFCSQWAAPSVHTVCGVFDFDETLCFENGRHLKHPCLL